MYQIPSVVMPEIYQLGDAEWIQKILAAMNSTMREYARDKYAYVYKVRRDEDPVPHRRDNTGARAANTWLRLFFKKNYRSMKGYTEQPMLAPKAQPEDKPKSGVALGQGANQ
ncbi:hypothetical protein XBP1_450001 [Xenorhabdus bovienii str. puntauvense]|uniref:Uncharacterized protein n=1 Tax=Xenorhabdus bovienii str. puntauvense TaxID=1398201 RepID=A0A077NIX5_XENBV|nr:hypothetical protein [Xenorhabdus bovienii]CDG98679.1 hypothetical protein XBP1_450001 [Xenorhabdus bovienii str. puntauvense]